MNLDGKRILVTGVRTHHSIAFAVAQRAQEAGAEIVLTGFGRTMRMTKRAAQRLDGPPDVLELDVHNPADFLALRAELAGRWGRVDGAVHSIAAAPPGAIGNGFLGTSEEDAVAAFTTSAFSLKSLAEALAPLMENANGAGGSIVGFDFDARVAWPQYDWMGVAKASLESIARYLARDLGAQRTRVNLVSAGPLRTAAAQVLDNFDLLVDVFAAQAPLGWDAADAYPTAEAACLLLSDWARGITGSVVHVDGGFHAMGTAPADNHRAMAEQLYAGAPVG
ncbi:MAG TPA: enoyl-ACP reductase FabI [Thermoleophilaceae bacterium]|jgi:enoyl-[acyl-carrier protein] reductase I